MSDSHGTGLRSEDKKRGARKPTPFENITKLILVEKHAYKTNTASSSIYQVSSI